MRKRYLSLSVPLHIFLYPGIHKQEERNHRHEHNRCPADDQLEEKSVFRMDLAISGNDRLRLLHAGSSRSICGNTFTLWTTSSGVFMFSLFYLAGITSLCIATTVWGMLADRFGRKLMLLRASYGAALLYPLLVFAPNFQVMLLIRFLCPFFRERSIRRRLCWYARRLQKNTVSCSARSAPPSGAETWSAT